jgi:hypothetical protein
MAISKGILKLENNNSISEKEKSNNRVKFDEDEL